MGEDKGLVRIQTRTGAGWERESLPRPLVVEHCDVSGGMTLWTKWEGGPFWEERERRAAGVEV